MEKAHGLLLTEAKTNQKLLTKGPCFATLLILNSKKNTQRKKTLLLYDYLCYEVSIGEVAPRIPPSVAFGSRKVI